MGKQTEVGKGDRNRSNTDAFRSGYDKIKWVVVEKCRHCDGELINGICQKLLDQQTRNNK